jgi:DNA replication and repair protein RecF
MFIESLSISNFRNFASLTAGFSPGVNIFLGNNGSGKTNLLEAIFSLCLGRSQRGVSDNVLLRKGADVYRLAGEIKTGSRQLAVAVAYQKGGRKKITIDKVTAKASQLYEHFSVVASGPEDSEILSGPPSARRLFLDIYLSQFLQTYLAELADYHRALRQKNAALKNEMDASPFDRLLVSCGAKIMLARGRFMNSLGPLAVQYHADIAGGERLYMEYKPSVPGCGETDDLGVIEAAFEAAIKDQARREQAIQTALVGPHRDELEFVIDGLPARTHGSQGQWRTAAISLKLAIYDLLRAKRDASPVILLDEIFAELDHLRAERLMALFGRADQLFLTTAADAPLTGTIDVRKFKIVNGNVEDSC